MHDIACSAGAAARPYEDINHIVVHEHWTHVELAAEVKRLEETIVDDHLAGDALDSGSAYRAREPPVARERIRFGENGVAQAVGFVVVPIADGDRSVGVCAAAHGEIAGSNDDKVAVQHAAYDAARAVNRRIVPVIWADCVEQ